MNMVVRAACDESKWLHRQRARVRLELLLYMALIGLLAFNVYLAIMLR